MEGEQENGVSRKRTTCSFFQLEKLALQKDGKTDHYSSKKKGFPTFAESSKGP